MEWAAVIRDIALGLLIAGAIAAWVPNAFWHHLFVVDHPLLSKIWGPLIGPVISLLSFVCSIGNVPLAGVLWNDGISFGGVVASSSPISSSCRSSSSTRSTTAPR